MKKIDLSQVLLTVIVLLITIAFSSCTKEEVPSNLHKFAIEYADDELGLAYGKTTEVNGAETKIFDVVAPYDCVVYDSVNNIHYLDISKFEDNPDSLATIQLSTHQLAGF